MMNNDEGLVRLQKYLARSGIASRRKSEQFIVDGRVSVNGKVVTELGSKVNPKRDIVAVDGNRIELPDDSEQIVIMLNKPKGYLSAMSDARDVHLVSELIPLDDFKGLFPIGRLDFNTSGLLLFTNDGELGNALLHPSSDVVKRYVAVIQGRLTDEEIFALENGVELEDGMTSPAKCIPIKSLPDNQQEVALEIHEGKKRQVRRMFKHFGHEVVELERTNFGPLVLGDLERGKWRALDKDELLGLYTASGVKSNY